MKKLNIFLDNGFLNFQTIFNIDVPFIFIVGGRGTGKTYGALKEVIEEKLKFLLLRRTQKQTDLINKPEFCPFKKLNSDLGWNISTKSISKDNAAFYNFVKNDQDKDVPEGVPLGYTAALSTISSMRGFDASDVEIVINDEFIPEAHERPLKEEFMAFLNMYETINRNRELSGDKPLKVVSLANANRIDNDIFIGFKLVNRAENMILNNQMVWIDKKRGICLILIQDSPVSNAKADTALYRAAADVNEFMEMSISNRFKTHDDNYIRSYNLRDFKAIVKVGEICIYKHKSKSLYYVSTHVAGSPPTFEAYKVDLNRFTSFYYKIWENYIEKRNVYFENRVCEILFKKYYM